MLTRCPGTTCVPMAQVLSSTHETLRSPAFGCGPASSTSASARGHQRQSSASCTRQRRQGYRHCEGPGCASQPHGAASKHDDSYRHPLCRQRQGQGLASSSRLVDTHCRTTFQDLDGLPSSRFASQASGGGQGNPNDLRTAEWFPVLRESEHERAEDDDDETEIPNSSVPILSVDGYNEWHHISHPPPYKPGSQASDSKSIPRRPKERHPSWSNGVATSSSTGTTDSAPAQVRSKSLLYPILLEAAGIS